MKRSSRRRICFIRSGGGSGRRSRRKICFIRRSGGGSGGRICRRHESCFSRSAGSGLQTGSDVTVFTSDPQETWKRRSGPVGGTRVETLVGPLDLTKVLGRDRAPHDLAVLEEVRCVDGAVSVSASQGDVTSCEDRKCRDLQDEGAV